MTVPWHTRPIALAAAAFALLCTLSEASTARTTGACDRLVTAGSGRGSVQEMVDALAPGESGCLHGAFSADVTIRRGGLPGRPVTIRSAPGTRATLRGRLWVPDSADDVVVEGLLLDGRNGDGLPSPTVHGDRVTFRGNEVTNVNTGICFVLGSFGGGWGIAVGTVIEGNRIHHCGELPATNHQHGIYVESARGARIVGNHIHDNADRGIQLYPDAQGTLIGWNLIDRNGQGILFSGVGGRASSGNRVIGNVIANSRLRYNVESWYPEGNPVGVGNVVQANCIWNGRMGEIARRVGFVGRANVLRSPRLRRTRGGEVLASPSGPCAAMGPPLDRVRIAPAVAAASGTAPRSARTREIQALPEARPAGRLESAATLVQSLVDDVNALRRAKGLAPLAVSPALAAAARFHSRSMARRGYFSHTSADGTPFSARIKRFYRPRRGTKVVGENILWASPALTADRALEMWLSSPPHRRVLLTHDFELVGIGAAYAQAAPGAFGGLDVVIVVADFAADR
jgi:parallel beta-helix repeat protein